MQLRKTANYIASRTVSLIRKFDKDLSPIDFRCKLPDNPEFLLWTKA